MCFKHTKCGLGSLGFMGFFLSLLMLSLCLGCKETDSIRIDLEKNGGLQLPDGFEAIAVVNGLEGKARHLAIRENGDIFVKLRLPDGKGGNAVLRDRNGDGRADKIKIFSKYPIHGKYGTAMRIHQGYLYFSSQTTVYRQKLQAGKLLPDKEMEVMLEDDLGQARREHIAKPIAFDDQGHFYIPFGAPSNSCQDPKRTPLAPGLDPCPQLDKFAGVWRFDLNKKNQRASDGFRVASGIRSLVGLSWNPIDRELYAVIHGRDDLLRLFPDRYSPWQSALLPSEEFVRIEQGSNFGWPYCYYDQMQEKKVLSPEYGGDGQMVGRCSTFSKPLIGFPGHWAPNDILFYQGDQFPDRYKNGAFIAFHGSTNRTPYPQSGYFVGFVPFEDGKPSGSWEVFADGFARVDTIVNVTDAVFRPMGLAEGPDGSLYISDTEQGAIWRVKYSGMKADFGPPALAAMMTHKQKLHIRTPDAQQDRMEQPVEGRGGLTYKTYCATCHQSNGKGDGSRFPPLDGADWVTGDKTRLIALTLQGLAEPIEVKGQTFTGLMPQHAFLTDVEIAEVLTYIRSSFGNEASPIKENEVATVRKNLAATSSTD
ncbi:MAG: PQQ-dependent sugar dehydrogenase [Saprospiraceae bacterium]|nr:PQQ-dependent sugar dehydrogenase [Saprospiraceae bacterium]